MCIGGRNNSPRAVSRYQQITLSLQLRRAFRKISHMIGERLGRRTLPAGLSDVICYDPQTDRWSDLPPLPHRLYAPAAGVIGDRVIVTNGGRDGWKNPSDATFSLALDELSSC